MKTIRIILLAIVVAAGFNACSEDDDLIILTPNQEFDIILEPQSLSSIEPTDVNADFQAERFTWSAADFGVPTAINYQLQLDRADGDYTGAVSLGTTSELQLPVTFGQMNLAALDLGLEANTPSLVKVRVRATTADAAAGEVLSNEVTFTLTPFLAFNFKELYLVGAATAAGWDNNNNNFPLVRDPNNDKLYSYTGFFTADQFKLLEIKGQWQPQWGTNGGSDANLNDGNGSDPNTFSVPAAGYYDFSIDITGATNDIPGTFSIAPNSTAGSAPTFTTVGYIGDATADGWNSDQDMMQSSFDPHIWYASGVILNAGEMKFRADNDWAVNWGTNTEFSGFAVQDGPNIPVVLGGTYTIFFNDITGGYSLILED